MGEHPESRAVLAGRYELSEQIGVGGSARVHRAFDRRLGRDVAVKVLDEALADSVDPAARRRFEVESRTAATFSHPNAVAIFDAGSDRGSLFIVMELVRGMSLAQRLATGPLSSAETARLGAQVASALGAAHRVGVIHRDVKPSNILIDERGDAKLTDFGIAQRFDEIEAQLTSTGMVVGTQRYLSPEQAAGQPLGPTTDVFSLGVVLFEAVTGVPATSVVDRAPVAGLDPRSIDPSVDPVLATAIVRATAVPTASRYADVDLFARDLAPAALPAALDARSADSPSTAVMPAHLEPTVRSASTQPTPPSEWPSPGPGTPAPPARVGEQLARHRRRRRFAAVGIGLAVVSALLIIGVALGRDDPPASSSAPASSISSAPLSTDPPATTAETAAPPTSLDAPTTTPTTVPPVPIPEIVPGFPAPGDVEEFIELLADRAEVAGSKADELARELDRLVARADRQQDADKLTNDADKLSDKIDKWVEDDELDASIADIAREFIDDAARR